MEEEDEREERMVVFLEKVEVDSKEGMEKVVEVKKAEF
jgi:hypothetical protein